MTEYSPGASPLTEKLPAASAATWNEPPGPERVSVTWVPAGLPLTVPESEKVLGAAGSTGATSCCVGAGASGATVAVVSGVTAGAGVVSAVGATVVGATVTGLAVVDTVVSLPELA